ncbi:cupin domain-containing protein, partial [Caulobacter sp. 602-1]|uniref:cupin domain-containing protein n=1 Tax=Caulobacter sp. 602-1 TaxID=2492472 RepID=UPI000FADE8F1
MSAARNDVLSEVLTLIRLRGELVYTAILGAPWGLRFQAGPAHFHFVESGEMWITPTGEGPILTREGDLVLLPQGTGHVMTDALGSPVESIETAAA